MQAPLQNSSPAVPRTPAASTPIPRSSGRLTFIRWLRKFHGWIGLWGAIFGLFFGTTGFLQNHRGTLRIPTAPPVVSTMQMPVPTPPPHSAKDLATYVQEQLNLERPGRVRREPSQAVSWGDRTVIQPEHWTVRYMTPKASVEADYWKGGSFININRRDNGVIAIMESLHRGDGVKVGWVLVADSMAGSLILLSITGVLLWTELNRRKLIGASIFCAAVVVGLVFAAQSV
jgi:hypothetical protein